jgi:GDP-D-mannose dehydratase
MARSAQITVTKVQNHLYLALLPCKNAKKYQPSSSEMFGNVQEMPQTKNTRFYPGSPNGCSRGLNRKKYVKGEKKFFRPAGVGYLIGDSSKAKTTFCWGAKGYVRRACEMMVKADVERLKPR